jgi:hypothetical protein
MGVAFLGALLAIVTLWALSKPRTPLQYMVGGTLATSLLLAAAFVQIVKKGHLGAPPRLEAVPPRTPGTSETGPPPG